MSATQMHAKHCTECGKPCKDARVVMADDTISEDAITFESDQGHVIVEGGMIHVYLHENGGDS